ncbi:MAG: Ig-like domain-containing protein [Chlorobiaceae bacterium]|nr:Ig-like domain-containing protein [Chlorobiaceae bacterium]
MKAFSGLKILSILLIPLLLCACAVDRPPSGGPPDNTPLKVTSSFPESGAIKTSTKLIRLVFSHMVNRDDLEKSIFFTPAIKGYHIEVHGKEGLIRFDQPLQQERTWSLTLRSPLKSVYGNHRLDQGWTLTFSTGQTISKGTITGKVWNDRMAPAQGVTLMVCGPISGNIAPIPGLTAKPDHITQTGLSGEFRFDNLAPGSYRLLAITDTNANLQFDPASEAFAVTSSPLVETGENRLSLRLSTEQLAPPVLQSCRTINNREIEITFDRPVPTRSLDITAFRIETTGNGAGLPISALFTPSGSDEENVFRLMTAPMDSKAWYRIIFSPDATRNTFPDLTFPGNAHQERYPALSVNIIPSDGSNNIITESIRPESGSSVELQFNLPVTTASVTSAVTLFSIEKGIHQPIPFTISRIDNRTFSVLVSGGFRQAFDYMLRVNPGMIETLTGQKGGKRVAESGFSTAGRQAYGEIAGTGTAANTPLVIIEARLSGTAMTRQIIARPVNGLFSFTFTDLPPGEYSITGFIPSATASPSHRNRWYGGSATPFVPCDPWVTQTTDVRSGWRAEKVRLDIPPVPRQEKTGGAAHAEKP